MSSLFTDTIRKTGGTLGTDIRINNTSVYESDGGTSVTQNTVQSLVKTWAINDHTSTSVLDSFNQSSITDTSTGILTWDVTNNFSSVIWPASSNLHADNGGNAVSMVPSGT